MQSGLAFEFQYMHYQTRRSLVELFQLWKQQRHLCVCDICCQTVKLKGWCKDSQQAGLGAEVSFNTLPGGHESAFYGKLFLLWRCQTTVRWCFTHTFCGCHLKSLIFSSSLKTLSFGKVCKVSLSYCFLTIPTLVLLGIGSDRKSLVLHIATVQICFSENVLKQGSLIDVAETLRQSSGSAHHKIV